MLTILIVLGILWLVLKVLTLVIEIPFRAIHLIFSALGSAVFWVILIALIFIAVL